MRQKDRKLRLEASKLLRENYLESYNWEKPCSLLVEKMQNLAFGKIM